ncbi:YvcK family protein [Corallococcus sp. AB011P]|uniref:gluconeogenesis factor YvcK family protein n=1 Tax=unclassified Corallococcus TaxID=2685029 RepID=UPI000EA37DA3|nr:MULTISPECIES: gluconeogenesis factor YvcK family protein [unclassified Corallococcus]RKG57674.1 YvcK family protein [Corallococcus sp. AB011P]RKH90345.1 YvcK family protein [Corallococcus sp. AB045]
MVGMDVDAPFSEQWSQDDARNKQQGVERNELLQAPKNRPTRIVAMGGGTGLPMVLKGLARRAAPKGGQPGVDITAVVAMSDDGGSSGRLRRQHGALPPGDIRNCLVALAGGKSALKDVFQYRFGGAKGLAGHAVGNLLIAALAELKGDFLEAVRLSGELLGAKGQVLPSTLASVQLVAQMHDDTEVVGERNICRAQGRVRRVSLSPRSPPPVDGLLEAIYSADLIAIGPGSLYSSVLPNLLVDGVAQALKETRALKVMVANLMTQPGETDGMNCLDHVQAVIDHVGPVLDAVLVNGRAPSDESIQRYARKGSFMVTAETRELLSSGVIPVQADLLKEGSKIRHDSRKVAACLLKMARSGL